MSARAPIAVGLLALVLAGCSSGHPGRLHAFGRTYDRGSVAAMTLAQVRSHFGSDVVILADGKRVSGVVGPYVPTVVVVREGSRYYEYSLEGGP